jgi:hypothetical protein
VPELPDVPRVTANTIRGGLFPDYELSGAEPQAEDPDFFHPELGARFTALYERPDRGELARFCVWLMRAGHAPEVVIAAWQENPRHHDVRRVLYRLFPRRYLRCTLGPILTEAERLGWKREFLAVPHTAYLFGDTRTAH